MATSCARKVLFHGPAVRGLVLPRKGGFLANVSSPLSALDLQSKSWSGVPLEPTAIIREKEGQRNTSAQYAAVKLAVS